MIIFIFYFITLTISSVSLANESLCAEVKIEILQEMTLERQGFEALMRITNSLDSFPLEDVKVTVNFADETGNPVSATSNPAASDAAFFIRIDDTRNFSQIEFGANGLVEYGRIAPKQEGELRWLIIPTANAAAQRKDGKLYFVGAQLSYSYGGKEEKVTVAADTIVVKPQPLLTLDYFLTKEVIGDDAFTSQIEPPEPYTLGVRVTNTGYGDANAVKIESAQPRIVENDKGLAVDFRILGSYLNDYPAEPTLLLDFGSIAPQGVTTGRWIMQTNLSGKFTAFNASFTHADELGGALTSLLDSTNAYLLVRDVQVDIPGRDSLRDFLAYSVQQDLFLYESENTGQNSAFCQNCSPVAQPVSSYNHQGITGQLTHDPAAAFSHAKFSDPFQGSRTIAEVIRSDGRIVHPQNVWISKERADDNITFNYFLNIFDYHSTGNYRINWGLPIAELPQAPVIQYIADRTTYEGGSTGFLVQATDPNNTIPQVSVLQLPTGASFTNQASNVAVFQWSPTIGQAGVYPITFVATDGILSSQSTVTIRVNPHYDIDGDGMDDEWELEHFGNLDRDGTGDADGDGRSDLQEFLEGTNPNVAEAIPGTPKVLSPLFDADTLAGTEAPFYPVLAVINSVHGNGISNVSVIFEVYSDEGLSTLVAEATVPEGNEATEWHITEANIAPDTIFEDNTLYYWRARAIDGSNTNLSSAWVKSRFFINTENDAPSKPVMSSPATESRISEYRPELIVANATDPDRDRLYYGFAIYEESNPGLPLMEITNLPPGINGHTRWHLPNQLLEDNYYLWHAWVSDKHGATTYSDWASFSVSTENHAPSSPAILFPEFMAQVGTLDSNNGLTLKVNNAMDPEREPLLYYFELDIQNTFDTPAVVRSPAINEGIETTSWKVANLEENTTYFWRVKASDGSLSSSWSTGAFMVTSINEAPSVPVLQNPVSGTAVVTLRPLFEINPSVDPEQSAITYEFRIFSDESLSTLVAETETDALFWTLDFDLTPATTYYWQVRAKDENNLASDWSNTGYFTVSLPQTNHPPEMQFVLPDSNVTVENNQILLQWIDSDPDSSALISLFYHYENGSPQLIAEGINEDANGEGDQYLWITDGLPAGSYTISAIIADEDTSVTVYLCCEIVIPEQPDVPVYGNGLQGYYYSYFGNINNLSIANQHIEETEPTTSFVSTVFNYIGTGGLGLNQNLINFLGEDAINIQGNIFSSASAILNFSGKIYLEAGNYRFRITSDDGYSIRINNEAVAEYTTNTGATARTHAIFQVPEEGWQDIDIVYWDAGQGHRLFIEMTNNQASNYQPVSNRLLKHRITERTLDNRPLESDDLIMGLDGTYYSYEAPNPNIVTINEVISHLETHESQGTFIATTLLYGPGTNGLGRNNNLLNFLGSDAQSLSVTPLLSNSVILRMQGYIELSKGTYRFRVKGDDGYQIKLNNKIVAEKSSSGSATVRTYNLFKIEDEGFYEIDVIYWDNGQGHSLNVEVSDEAGQNYETLNATNLLRVRW